MPKLFVDHSVIFGYEPKSDAWSGCGNGLWWRINGEWPTALPWADLELERHTFRCVQAQDLDACGIDGVSLPQQLLSRVEPLVEAR